MTRLLLLVVPVCAAIGCAGCGPSTESHGASSNNSNNVQDSHSVQSESETSLELARGVTYSPASGIVFDSKSGITATFPQKPSFSAESTPTNFGVVSNRSLDVNSGDKTVMLNVHTLPDPFWNLQESDRALAEAALLDHFCQSAIISLPGAKLLSERTLTHDGKHLAKQVMFSAPQGVAGSAGPYPNMIAFTRMIVRYPDVIQLQIQFADPERSLSEQDASNFFNTFADSIHIQKVTSTSSE